MSELLFDHLRDLARKASPQVIHVPYQVKYFHSNSIQTCNLDDKSISDYPTKLLVKVENILRTSGFATEEKIQAADWIQAYCLKNIKKYDQLKNQLKSSTSQPSRPTPLISERDRIYDKDLLLNLKEIEEGEMTGKDLVD